MTPHNTALVPLAAGSYARSERLFGNCPMASTVTTASLVGHACRVTWPPLPAALPPVLPAALPPVLPTLPAALPPVLPAAPPPLPAALPPAPMSPPVPPSPPAPPRPLALPLPELAKLGSS